jgi:hypothetical protein
MTRRLLGALRALVAEPTADAGVHFHADCLKGEPAACFETGCKRPALDVR